MDLPPPTTDPFIELAHWLDVEIGTDPESGWTQVVYKQHLLSTHEPEFGGSTVRLHLIRDNRGRLEMDGGKLLDGFQRLQEHGYRLVDRSWAPFSETKSLEIVTLEGHRVGPDAMRSAIVNAVELSRDAIDHRDLMDIHRH